MSMQISDCEIKAIGTNFTMSKSITQLNVEKLWELGFDGEGMHIAVLDTGCDVEHEYLKDNIVEVKSFISGVGAMDIQGHGTHVSGICKSVAPNVSLHIYKVLGDNGRGDNSNVTKAILYSIEQKVDVINMSLGSIEADDEMRKAIQKAVDNGICVVCASGNDARGDDGEINEINYPAFYRECVAVGSVTKSNIPSKFSNSNFNVDVVAYGDSICSSYPGNKYATCSGTSQATPQVSAFLVLLKQKFIHEFGRLPECESELYGQLIKNTKTLKGIDRRVQGHGVITYIDFY